MVQALRIAAHKLSVLGPKSFCLCLLKKLLFRAAAPIFGFDPWHVAAIYDCRNYKRLTVDMVHKLGVDSVVEIGCGIGDIISRVEAQYKVGIDTNASVCRAAKFFYGRQACFIAGDFCSEILAMERDIDALIVINVFGDLIPDAVAADLGRVISEKGVRYLLIDFPTNSPRQGFHDETLSTQNLAFSRIETAYDGEARHLLLYEFKGAKVTK